MRLKALAESYTMHSFAQLCNLNFFSKIARILPNFAKIFRNAKFKMKFYKKSKLLNFAEVSNMLVHF